MRASVKLSAFVFLLVAVFAAQHAAAQGQTSGSIRGVVTDPDGMPVPGVTVIARSDALVAGQQVAITNGQGVYRFPSLPPAVYEIEGVLEGFQNVLQQSIKLDLGQDLKIDLQLGNLAVADEIVVVAESVEVSTVSNAADFNVTEDFLSRQPLGRNPIDVMNFAPGIQGDQAYGAPSTYQNAFNMDGVDVSDPELGSQWILPSMEWIQEVQVAGIGANAEYGDFTGAVVNVITKSGGNEFHGDLVAYYSDDSLNSDNAPPGTEGSDTLESDLDASLSLGGPIARDKVWYFVSGNYRQVDVSPFFQTGAPVDDRASNEEMITRLLGKVTWQVNSSNKAQLFIDKDDKEEDYRGVGSFTLASGAQFQDSPNTVYGVSWESLLSNASFMSLKLTGYDGADDRLPYFGDTPNRFDRESRFDWANLTSSSFKDVNRLTFDGSLSLFADGLLAADDSHNFKFGVVYNDFSSDFITVRNGGFSYYDDSWYCSSLEAYFDDPFCGVFSSDWGGEWNLQGEMSGLHFYAQDEFTVGRIAINAGVRFTQYTGGFANASSDVYDESVWAPRLGFVWDLFGNSKAALKLHYGRYHESMTVTLYDREQSGDALSNLEFFDYNFDTGEFDIPAGGSVVAEAAMDPDIGHPYVDQYAATFEYQLASEMLLGVDYVYREFGDINAMVTSNLGDYLALDAPGNPLTGGSLPFFELLAPQENVITNPQPATREYQSVTLRFRKRYTNGWSADASLVWSDLTGNADFDLSGYGSGFNDLNGFTNADGTLPGNPELVFKVSASVDLPWRFLLSGFYQFRTGTYWTPYATFEGLFFNDRQPIYLTGRGSQQYPDRQVLDLRLQKDFGLGNGMSVGLFVDVFNLLDGDETTGVDSRWGRYDYDYADHPGSSQWVASSTYQDVTAIQAPRSVRLGAKFSW